MASLIGRARMVAAAGVNGGATSATSAVNTGYHPGLPAYLGGGGPGGWASNHYAESKQVTGWNFCAVRAVARACAKSKPAVMATGRRARQHVDRATKMVRKGLLANDVLVTLKSSMTSSSGGDDAVPLPSTFPLCRLLRRPNPWMSWSQFAFQNAQQLTVTGTAMNWIMRNGYAEYDKRGVPVRLFCIPTGLTTPMIPDAAHPAGIYRVMPVGSFGGANIEGDTFGDAAWSSLMLTGGVIDGREMRMIRWPHPLFLTDGLSPLAAGELWIDIASRLDKATWYGFRNTLRPSYVFEMDNEVDEPSPAEDKRFMAEIAATATGVDNTSRPIRLPKGVKIADATRSVAELDYIHGREAIGSNVLALHATPPVAIGVQQAGAYAAYYASLVQFVDQAVEPILSLMADDYNHELTPAFGEDLEIQLPAPPVNDHEQDWREVDLVAGYGCMTYNELRKKKGLPPWSKEQGGDLPVGTAIARLLAESQGIDPDEIEQSPTPEPEPAVGPNGQSMLQPGQNRAAAGKPRQLKPTGRASQTGGAKPPPPKTRKEIEVEGYFRPASPATTHRLNGVH